MRPLTMTNTHPMSMPFCRFSMIPVSFSSYVFCAHTQGRQAHIRTDIVPGHINKTFLINVNDIAQIQSYLSNTLVTGRTIPTGANFEQTSVNPTASGGTGPLNIGLTIPLGNADNVTALFEAVGTAVTNIIRMTANGTVAGGQTRAAPTSLNGTVYVSETFIEVDYRWLSLPILVVLTGLGALLVTMTLATSHKRVVQKGGCRANAPPPLWKSSNLGLLYHGVEADNKNRWCSSDDDRTTSSGTAANIRAEKRTATFRAGTINVELLHGREGRLTFKQEKGK